jgi:hypothetical protein
VDNVLPDVIATGERSSVMAEPSGGERKHVMGETEGPDLFSPPSPDECGGVRATAPLKPKEGLNGHRWSKEFQVSDQMRWFPKEGAE